MANTPVVHLHNHTTYSLRDGLQKLSAMCAAAEADGQPALAITDHGNLTGAWQFAKEASAVGIKPVIGTELYLAHGSRMEKISGEGLNDFGQRGKAKSNQHLTVLVRNAAGWANLTTLMRKTYDSVWHKPRADMALLAEHSDGLMVLTGCLGGPVAGPLAIGEPELAAENLETLVDIMGREYLAVEVMHHGIESELRIMPDLVRLAKRFGLPVVATNDSHFTDPGDAVTHKAWLCSGQKGVTLSTPSPPRWEFPGQGYHLRSTAEMRSIFDGQPGTERAVTASYIIAEKIDTNVLPERRSRLPKMPVRVGQTAAGALWELVRDGAREKYGSPPPQAVQDRLRYEMRVIANAGLADYFLVVSDLIRWATERGIRTSVRGSAVGCAVAYCSGITSIDPLAYGLLFERFLNPERAGMPDIDVDCERDRQGEMISYLAEKWGPDHVARLGTLGLEKTRSAIRAVGRVLGEQQLADELSRLVPTGPGGQPLPFDTLMDPESGSVTEPFRRHAANSKKAERLVSMASSFAGVASVEGVHACGVVVSAERLVGLVPLRQHTSTGQVITAWDGHDVEEVGLLKLDLLRLRTLDIISHAVQLIEASTGELLDTTSINDNPAADPRSKAAWDLIGSGDTAGLFQLDGSGMTKLVMDIRPRSVSDLAVVIALYRPGPLGQGLHERYALRRHGREAVDYTYLTSKEREVAVLEGALGETHGVPIYQEQIMGLGDAVAGFGPGTRNRLQKAVSKKDRDEMVEVGRMFVEGATAAVDEAGNPKVRFSRDTALRVWATMQSAGSYAFNKSHAVGYASLSFLTAYLSANWPAAFGAALLAATDRADKRFSALHSLSAKGVMVLPPSVNDSSVGTTIEDDKTIRFGLSEVMAVGAQGRAVVAERESAGRYTSLADFVGRSGVPSNVAEALIQSGALDEFGPRLGQMMVVRGLKSTPDLSVPDLEWGVVERAARERHLLKVQLSEHPLVTLGPQVIKWPHNYDRMGLHGEFEAGSRYTVVGVVSSIEIIQRSYRLAHLTLEGVRATRECVIWGDLLGRLEGTGRTPLVGQIVQCDVVAKVRVVERSSEDGEEPQETDGSVGEPQISLTVLDVSAGHLEDPLVGEHARTAL